MSNSSSWLPYSFSKRLVQGGTPDEALASAGLVVAGAELLGGSKGGARLDVVNKSEVACGAFSRVTGSLVGSTRPPQLMQVVQAVSLIRFQESGH